MFLKLKKTEKELLLKVNQIDNFLRIFNIEIHGVPVSDNEKTGDVEKVVIGVLKLVDLSDERNHIASCRRMMSKKKAEDGTSVFNTISVKLRY